MKYFAAIVAGIVICALLWLRLSKAGVEDSSISAPSGSSAEVATLESVQAVDGRRVIEGHKVSTAAGVTFLVSDDANLPIEGAKLSANQIGDTGFISLGQTDSSGSLALQFMIDAPCVIRTTCPGYLTEEIVLDSERDSLVVRIQLRPSTIAAGIVVSTSGEGIAGVTVLMWPKEIVPAWDLALRAKSAFDASAIVARTDASGRFEALGAKQGSSYWAVAGGSGLATFDAKVFVPSRETVILRVGYLYGCRVKLVGAGENMQLGDLAAPMLDPVQIREVAATYLLSPSFVPALLGISTEQAYGSMCEYEYLFVSPLEVEDIGPARFELSVPGCVPVSELIRFPRIIGSISEQAIVLQSAQDETGECEFSFDLPVGFDIANVSVIGDLARVYIHQIGSLSGQARPVASLQLRVKASGDGTSKVRLPLGSYDARLVMMASTTSIPDRYDPPIPFEVTREGASVRFDLADCGGIAIDLRTPGGERASGALNLVLMEGSVSVGDESVANPVFLPNGPHLVAPIRAGTYTVIVQGHSFLNPKPQINSLLVEPGAWTPLLLSSN